MTDYTCGFIEARSSPPEEDALCVVLLRLPFRAGGLLKKELWACRRMRRQGEDRGQREEWDRD
jgi:hypothetical protein